MKELNFEQMEQVKGGDFCSDYLSAVETASVIGTVAAAMGAVVSVWGTALVAGGYLYCKYSNSNSDMTKI